MTEIYAFKVKDFTTVLIGQKGMSDRYDMPVYYVQRGDGRKYEYYEDRIEWVQPLGEFDIKEIEKTVITKEREKAKKDIGQLYKYIGRRIYRCRKNAELTQEELARLIGAERTSITQYENGNIRISLIKLYEISEALHRSIFDFLP